MTDTTKPNGDRLPDREALDRNDRPHRRDLEAVHKSGKTFEAGPMITKHPNWRCPGCGAVMYCRGACHHAYGCKEHPGCEKYREAKYRASGMWPLNWSRERVQRSSGKSPSGTRELHGPGGR